MSFHSANVNALPLEVKLEIPGSIKDALGIRPNP